MTTPPAHQEPRGVRRREALALGALGGAALLLPLERTARSALANANRLAATQLPTPFLASLPIPPLLNPVRSDATTDYFELTMREATVPLLPGRPPTAIYGYNGITPGPTIAVRRGRQCVVRQINALPRVSRFNYPAWTSMHLHGSPSLPQYDGYASDITDPGSYKDYVYPNSQDARTLWYHDHGVHHTAQNAYLGLAGQYLLHDDLEDSLPIPKSYGRYDIPLTVRDAIFGTDGQLIYDDNDGSSLYGDVILVNGAPWPVLRVERRKYRFRILNAAISRSFNFRLSTGQPMTVIGTDGGLMPVPRSVGTLRHGMGERYEVIIDFAQNRVGDRVTLQNLSNPNNVDFASTRQVMRFDVVGEATDTTDNVVPAQLNPNQAVMGLVAADSVRTREMVFKKDIPAGGTEEEWTVNGTTWQDVINSNYSFTLANPGLGDVEIWRLKTSGGGWFHPVHIHLIDFKVLSRTGGKSPGVKPYELGPKDVVYVGEGETVSVLMKFGPRTGRYMLHCHNLVHEDHDMMGQFQVGPGGDDPITAAPARPYDAADPPVL